MLQIENQDKELIIGLNEVDGNNFKFIVNSISSNGTELPWGIEHNSCEDIRPLKNGENELEIVIDIEKIVKNEHIIIKNYKNERFEIKFVPNSEVLRPKEYKFKITKAEANGRDLKVKILSKEGTNEVPWKCTYAGRPLSYDITPLSSDESGYVKIKLITDICSETIIIIEFTQLKSNKTITLKLLQGIDSVKILEKKVD